MTCFNLALSQIQQEITNISTAQSLIQSRNEGMDTHLFEQLSVKQNALTIFKNCIEKSLQVAKSTLRGVNVTGISGLTTNNKKQTRQQFIPHMNESFTFTDNTVNSTISVINHLGHSFDTFSLEFNDLTMSHDSGENDQAKITIDKCKKFCTSVDLHCKETSGLDIVLQVISSDKYGHELPKRAAIQMLTSWQSNLSTMKKAQDKTRFANKDIEVEVVAGGKEEKNRLLEEMSFDDAIKRIESLADSAIVNIRYKSGNSDIYNDLKKSEVAIQLVDCKKAPALQVLHLITETTIGLNIQSQSTPEFMKKLSNLQLAHPHVTLLQCSPDRSGWTSLSVPTAEGHLHKEDYENAEIIFKDLALDEAKNVINTCCGEKDTIELRINHVNRKTGFFSSIRSLRENKLIFSKTKLIFMNIQNHNYKDIISCLRNKLSQLQFSLVLNELNLKSAIQALRNADLSMEPIQESKQTLLCENFSSEWLPVSELWELQLRGIHILCEYNEKSPIPWFSITCVLGLAAAQFVIGGVLICTGFGASIGMGLITEGAADVFTAYRAYSNRQFSWTSYGAQKAVSLAVAAISAGVGKLKDAGKGLQTIGENVARETGERALTEVMTEGGKTVAIEATKKNLKTLAVKQVGVALGEAAAREGLNALVSMGSQVVMANYKADVVSSVERKVQGQFFTNSQLLTYVRVIWALDKLTQCKTIDSKIKSAVQETIHPKSGSFNDMWNSVGYPLLQGVLSSSQQVGGLASIGFRLAGMINGMKEITFVIETVVEAIVQKLEGENPTDVMQILIHRLKRSPTEAQNIKVSVFKKQTSDDTSSIFKFDVISCPDKKVSEFFTKLNSTQGEFEVKKMSEMIKWISDTLTAHILKVVDTQLRAPVTTFLTSKAVSAVSTFVQSNFIVSAEHNTDELQGKEGITVAQQINAQAKQYMIQYQQLAISRKLQDSDAVEGGKIPPDVGDKIEKTLNGAPAGVTEMSTLAKLHGKQLVILTDKDSIPKGGDSSPDKIVVLYTPGTKETGGVGHYSLIDSSGQVVPIPSSNLDCGYAIFSHLNPGTTQEEMRLKVASYMHDHPKTFENVIRDEDWTQNRFPEDANKHLLVGGLDPGDGPRRTRKLSGQNNTSDNQNNDGENEDKDKDKVEHKIRESKKFKSNTEGDEIDLTTKSVSKIPPKASGENKPITELTDERKSAEELATAEAGSPQPIRRLHLDNAKQGGGKEAKDLAMGTSSQNKVMYDKIEKPVGEVKEEMAKRGIDGELIQKRNVSYPDKEDNLIRPLESIKTSIGTNNPEVQPLLDDKFAGKPGYKPIDKGDGLVDYVTKIETNKETGKAEQVEPSSEDNFGITDSEDLHHTSTEE